MNKSVLYVRYSSNNQRSESIDAQVRASRIFCEEKNLQIIHIYADRAKSGKTDKRPDFLRMIEDAKSGEFQSIVVHKLDRFSRNKYDSVFYKAELKKHGVRVLSVCENIGDNPAAIILESMLEGLSEYYLKNLSAETKKGLAENAYQCKHNGGKPPLGYDVDSKTQKYVVNVTEAELIKDIFEKYVNGWGYNKIVQYLNEKGQKTKRNGLFAKSSIYTILKNEKYMGVYIFNKVQCADDSGKRRDHLRKSDEEIIRIENGLPALISKKTFFAAQEKFKANKRKGGQSSAKRLYLLSGLIFCGNCKNSFQGNSRWCGRKVTKYTSYRCSLKSKSKHSCSNKEIGADFIENFVIKEVKRVLLSPSKMKGLEQNLVGHSDTLLNNKNDKTKELEASMKQVEKKIQRLVTAIKNGIAISSIGEELKSLEKQKGEIEYQLHRIEYQVDSLNVNQVKEALKKLKASIQNKDLKQCKSILPIFVDRIEVFLDHVEIQFKIDLSNKISKQVKINLHRVNNKQAMKKYRHAA